MKELSLTTPVQYEEGKASFMGMEITVDPRVLIPRPETELLVRTTSDICIKLGMEHPLILDVGTGSGIIPVGLARLMKDCRVIGSDISREALDVALKNVERLGDDQRIALVAADLLTSFKTSEKGTFDCIVSNPPYVSERDYPLLDAWVKAEPELALLGGKEGMRVLKALAKQSLRLIKPGGFLAVEVGYDQSRKMKAVLESEGSRKVTSFRDDNGYERVITGFKSG